MRVWHNLSRRGAQLGRAEHNFTIQRSIFAAVTFSGEADMSALVSVFCDRDGQLKTTFDSIQQQG